MKNNGKKRLLILLLSVIVSGSLGMNMTVLTQAAERSSTEEKSDGWENCGSGVEWNLTDGVLTVRGNGEIENSPWDETQVKSIIIQNGVTNIVSNIDLYDNLESIEIPGTCKVIKENALFGASKLSSIILHEGIEKIESAAFADTAITQLSIPASVTSIKPCRSLDNPAGFFRAPSLKSIEVAAGNRQYSSKDGVLYNKSQTELISYPCAKDGSRYDIPSGVQAIGENAFYRCSKLTNIIIPNTVTSIGYGAFYGCSDLKELIIPDKIKTIDMHTIAYCSKLTQLTFPASVESIGYPSLQGCSALKSVTILNKACNFAFCLDTITIYGYSGSTAEEYAIKNGHKFIAIDEKNNDSAKKINVSGIKISGDSNKIAAGKKIKLTVKILPVNATNKKVTWKSSNKKVATVNSSGVVTMKKGSGKKSVTITAVAQDGSGKKAAYKITSMKGIVKSIKISGKTSVKAGKSIKLKSKVTASKGANTKLKWTSSNTKYATVNSAGKVVTKKAGKGKKVKITVVATDGSNKKRSITVKIK